MTFWKTSALLAALLAPAMLLAHPASADSTVCTLDACLDASGFITGTAVDCSGSTTSATEPWAFTLVTNAGATVRDPPLGLFYLATWTHQVDYESDGAGGCTAAAESCVMNVSDGSHFEYVRVGSTSELTGSYKGAVPVLDGTLSCGTTCANLHTFLAGLRTVSLYGSCVPIGVTVGHG